MPSDRYREMDILERGTILEVTDGDLLGERVLELVVLTADHRIRLQVWQDEEGNGPGELAVIGTMQTPEDVDLYALWQKYDMYAKRGDVRRSQMRDVIRGAIIRMMGPTVPNLAARDKAIRAFLLARGSDGALEAALDAYEAEARRQRRP